MSYKSNLKEYNSKKSLELNYNSMQVEPPNDVFIPRIVVDKIYMYVYILGQAYFLYHI